VRELLDALDRPVELLVALGPEETPLPGARDVDFGEETQRVVEGIAALSDRVTFRVEDEPSGFERYPAVAVLPDHDCAVGGKIKQVVRAAQARGEDDHGVGRRDARSAACRGRIDAWRWWGRLGRWRRAWRGRCCWLGSCATAAGSQHTRCRERDSYKVWPEPQQESPRV